MYPQRYILVYVYSTNFSRYQLFSDLYGLCAQIELWHVWQNLALHSRHCDMASNPSTHPSQVVVGNAVSPWHCSCLLTSSTRELKKKQFARIDKPLSGTAVSCQQTGHTILSVFGSCFSTSSSTSSSRQFRQKQ